MDSKVGILYSVVCIKGGVKFLYIQEVSSSLCPRHHYEKNLKPKPSIVPLKGLLFVFNVENAQLSVLEFMECKIDRF